MGSEEPTMRVSGGRQFQAEETVTEMTVGANLVCLRDRRKEAIVE